jgi:hypothetical protein
MPFLQCQFKWVRNLIVQILTGLKNIKHINGAGTTDQVEN